MDFDDTPEEAAFRASARAWLDAEKPDDLLRDLAAAEARDDPAERTAGLVRASKAWQRRRPRPAGPACTGPRNMAGAARRRSSA